MAKRRKISSSKTTPQEGIISFSSSLLDLPVEPLTHVASFLAAPSQALFAVALKAPSSIIDHLCWDTLDFGEIEIELAKWLCDHHISNMLLSIDAVNKVKRLKLTNCINITGIGLQPLSGSAIIEHIDLTLTRSGQNSRIYENPAISLDKVLPFLDSIIAAEGCAVRKIEFPLKWREEASIEFIEFLGRYNDLWWARNENNSAICRCVKCKNNVLKDDEEGDIWVDTEGEQTGDDAITCTACLNHFCGDCNSFVDTDDDPEDLLVFLCAGNCGKQFCVECSTPNDCNYSECGDFYCTDCRFLVDHKCADSECNGNICEKCISNAKCGICEQLFCCDADECRVAITPCPCCNEPVCSDCVSKIRCNWCPVRWCKRCAEQGILCSSCKSVAKGLRWAVEREE